MGNSFGGSIDIEAETARLTPSVYSDAVEQIAPRIYNPRIAEEKNIAGTRWITEDVSFCRAGYQNLLQFAARINSPKCVILLCSSPFLWNVDRTDYLGRTALDYAEKNGASTVLYELARRTKKRKGLLDQYNSFPNTVGTFLLWPQLFNTERFRLDREYLLHIFETQRVLQNIHQSNYIEDLMEFTNPLMLLFELILATPHLCESSHRSLNGKDVYWPLATIDGQPSDHNNFRKTGERVEEFLFNLMETDPHIDSNYVWEQIKRFYVMHMFITKCAETHQWTPPSLKRITRARIRFYIVKTMESSSQEQEEITYQNYLQLTKQLGLSPDLLNYLHYLELWPTFITVLPITAFQQVQPINFHRMSLRLQPP